MKNEDGRACWIIRPRRSCFLSWATATAVIFFSRLLRRHCLVRDVGFKLAALLE